MAKMKQKGKSGATKNYVTRNQAIKKLQVTLADFRRLCILKGIFPRQPKSVRKANKGSTAPTTFFFAKDIAYLQHEPVLQSLRDHKTFAKKLSRTIGRREWAAAKNLDENKPTYRLDHIIKERYPTFRDSLKDIDDALSLLTLFANLPATDKVSADVIATCSRLCAEWQLYVMKTKALKKVFLSIKGIYFQAEVQGETITWLVPYLFTQHIPSDIDFRIMYTFLELYQTLLGFVLFKLYTDENLVYPPKFDASKDEQAAGFGALSLDSASAAVLRGENSTPAAITNGAASSSFTVITASGKKVSAKDVKKQIKAISKSTNIAAGDKEQEQDEDEDNEFDGQDERFVEQPSKSAEEQESTAHLTTFDEIQAASAANEGAANGLFTPYVFYISRECPRSVIEFVLRSFGALPGRIGWDMVAGAGSAVDEDDARITHHIIDRPVPANGMKRYPGKRVFVQPQYIVDCANARKLLPAGPYGPGQTLPPHLSPFVDDAEVARRGGYVPEEAREQLGLEADAAALASEDDEDEEEDEEVDIEEHEETDGETDTKTKSSETSRPALAALLADPSDSAEAGLLDAAELEAEAAGGEDALEDMRRKHTAALKQAKKSSKKSGSTSTRKTEEQEAKEMSKMMMSNRQRKLYEKLNYSSGKSAEETAKLQQKKKALNKKAAKAQK